MTHLDLGPAASRMAGLISAIPDNLLGHPTPCPAYTLGDLVEHVGGLTRAFTAAARKDTGGLSSRAPSGDGSRLEPDWRTRIPRDLTALTAAWRDPQPWTGMTEAGGGEPPGGVAGGRAVWRAGDPRGALAPARGRP